MSTLKSDSEDIDDSVQKLIEDGFQMKTDQMKEDSEKNGDRQSWCSPLIRGKEDERHHEAINDTEDTAYSG